MMTISGAILSFCVRPWSDTNKSAGDSLSDSLPPSLPESLRQIVQLIPALHYTVTDYDTTQPIVFKRKLHLEIFEIKIHVEKTNYSSWQYLSNGTGLIEIGLLKVVLQAFKLGR